MKIGQVLDAVRLQISQRLDDQLVRQAMIRVIWAKLKTMIGTTSNQDIISFQEMGQGISLVGIGVSPQFRGQKIGQKLMNLFEMESRAREMDFMRLSVYSNNRAAIKVYESCGWESVSPSQQAIWTFVKRLR